MSQLDKLIQQYCPDGVATVPLGEVAHYAKTRIDASEMNENNYVGVENLLQKKQGKTIASSVPVSGAVIAFECGDVLIGNIRPYLKKIWLADCNGGTNGDVLAVQINDRRFLMPEFLYYVLSSDHFFLYDMQNSKGAKMPRGSKKAVMKYTIPVPPLPVQSEIVRILDNFTELTARKKQYEFYRDKLLTFGDVRGGATSDVMWRTLGEVCNLQSGKAISAYLISETQTVENPIPCYGANGLRGYVSTSNESGDKPIVGRQGALCGNVCFATGSYYATEHAVVITDKGFFNSRFLYHLLVNADLNQYKTTGAQPGLSVARLNEVKVPVPTRTVQDRIANVLDNFDAICSDLNIGLPAEIEARQKQYEFYRDALLTYAATGKTTLTDRQSDRQTDRQTSLMR